MQRAYCGIDVGASRTKVAILDGDKNLVGHHVGKSGTDFAAAAAAGLEEALSQAGLRRQEVSGLKATGYGRLNVAPAGDCITEISCHARGCYHEFPQALTIIDIGGQDNKIIHLNEQGRRTAFRMNRKCAAGTGAFLEEMALRLDIPLAEMDALARKAQQLVELGSYCTVFSATEVLEKIRQGKQLPDIVKGLFLSVIRRIREMDPLAGTVLMTGGVAAHNPYLAVMMAEALGREILRPRFPQLTGAIGAALYALAEVEKEELAYDHQ